MTSKIMKYTLEDFNNITFNGFKFDFPQDTLQIISELSLEVGSPNYVKTPVFQKRENPMKSDVNSINKNFNAGDINEFNAKNNFGNNRRKRGNKVIEILNDADWEALRTFQTTKIEEKNGLDGQIDILRSNMNKLSDKNFSEIKEKILDNVDKIFNENCSSNEILRVVTTLFDIASTNRFYSKIYADLYTELIKKYDIMLNVFEENFNKFLNLFDVIEYVDPSVDYDKFCKINKDNEKRKALSAFFINLMNNNIISKDKIVNIVKNLLNQINNYISQDNKKNEVDELTENVAILYKKNLFNADSINDLENGISVNEFIYKLAHSKTKNYLSLTNKSIFKFMDLIDM
jgi:hypothetical protein